MKLFKDLTFARVMILLCLVGSGVLGFKVFENKKKIAARHESLAEGGEVENLVREIQSLSKQYTELYKKRNDEGLSGQANPYSYINGIAVHDHVQIGRVDIAVDDRELTKGIIDNVYTITPHEKDADFSRVHIANFLWSLEDQSRRVRVTDLKIEGLNDQGKARLKPHEYPSDRWKFSAKVTSRAREGSGAQ